jgi:signal peptidase II
MQSDSSERGRLPPSKTSLQTVATGLGIAILALAIDQIAKQIIASHFFPDQLILSGEFISLVYVTNTGSVCGYAQGTNQLLAALGTVTTLLIGVSLFFIPNSRIYAAAFGLLLAGAAGNLIDRFRLGHVIDFISVDLLGWPAFNLADVSIIAGIGIVGLVLAVQTFRDRGAPMVDAPPVRPGTVVAVILAGITAILGYILCVFRPFE